MISPHIPKLRTNSSPLYNRQQIPLHAFRTNPLAHLHRSFLHRKLINLINKNDPFLLNISNGLLLNINFLIDLFHSIMIYCIQNVEDLFYLAG